MYVVFFLLTDSNSFKPVIEFLFFLLEGNDNSENDVTQQQTPQRSYTEHCFVFLFLSLLNSTLTAIW